MQHVASWVVGQSLPDLCLAIQGSSVGWEQQTEHSMSVDDDKVQDIDNGLEEYGWQDAMTARRLTMS